MIGHAGALLEKRNSGILDIFSRQNNISRKNKMFWSSCTYLGHLPKLLPKETLIPDKAGFERLPGTWIRKIVIGSYLKQIISRT
jgi:hypothetical protein